MSSKLPAPRLIGVRFRAALLLAVALCAGWTASQAASNSSPWVSEFSAGAFVFRAEFPLRDVQDLVSDIGDLQAEIEETLGVTCSDREIQVHLFRNRAGYQRYLAIRVPDGVKRQALYMPGTDAGRIYAYRHRGLETDVRHETTHALLKNALPYVPLWLDEGLAEYFEVPAVQRRQGDGHLGELSRVIRWGWKPDLAALEAKRDFLEMGAKDYRDAWVITHFLLHGPPGARKALQNFLEEIESGAAPTPLSSRLRREFGDYEAEIVRHAKSL